MTEKSIITLTPIGIIHSPHLTAVGTPIQPTYAKQCEGQVIVDPGFEAALTDLDGFECVWLIYWFDRCAPYEPRVIPYRDTGERGLFATRSPCRPNPIGLSVVQLLGRERNMLLVRGIDVLHGTPLLDIKPYVPEFDAFLSSKAGWLDEPGEERTEADGRFRGGGEFGTT